MYILLVISILKMVCVVKCKPTQVAKIYTLSFNGQFQARTHIYYMYYHIYI